MTSLVESKNRAGQKTVRPSDGELHRAACKAIWESGHIVFQSLPNLVDLIIKHRVWKSLGHESFAAYALDTTSKGLGINSNQRLWILRCSLDVEGKHIAEWADLLAKVEEMVRVQAAEKEIPLRTFKNNSLKILGKSDVEHLHSGKITYLPSGSRNTDSQLLRLQGSHRNALRKVASGGLSFSEARKKAGLAPTVTPNPVRVRTYFRSLTEREREDFIEWLKEEGYL